MPMTPRPLPGGVHYAPCYCEENIWHLCRNPRLGAARKHVVFVSNLNRCCRLFYQRAAVAAETPVYWDYHVILLRKTGRCEVWDPDSTLALPTNVTDYMAATFGESPEAPAETAPMFRVIDADEFVAVFASDRSHMRDGAGDWRQPPPPWPPIGRAGANNLDEMIDMRRDYVGAVLDLATMKEQYGRVG